MEFNSYHRFDVKQILNVTNVTKKQIKLVNMVFADFLLNGKEILN